MMKMIKNYHNDNVFPYITIRCRSTYIILNVRQKLKKFSENTRCSLPRGNENLFQNIIKFCR